MGWGSNESRMSHEWVTSKSLHTYQHLSAMRRQGCVCVCVCVCLEGGGYSKTRLYILCLFAPAILLQLLFVLLKWLILLFKLQSLCLFVLYLMGKRTSCNKKKTKTCPCIYVNFRHLSCYSPYFLYYSNYSHDTSKYTIGVVFSCFRLKKCMFLEYLFAQKETKDMPLQILWLAAHAIPLPLLFVVLQLLTWLFMWPTYLFCYFFVKYTDFFGICLYKKEKEDTRPRISLGVCTCQTPTTLQKLYVDSKKKNIFFCIYFYKKGDKR